MEDDLRFGPCVDPRLLSSHGCERRVVPCREFASKLKAQPGILALSPFYSLSEMCKLQILQSQADSDPISDRHLESINYKLIAVRGGFYVFWIK
jgi:hypothetical protein